MIWIRLKQGIGELAGDSEPDPSRRRLLAALGGAGCAIVLAPSLLASDAEAAGLHQPDGSADHPPAHDGGYETAQYYRDYRDDRDYRDYRDDRDYREERRRRRRYARRELARRCRYDRRFRFDNPDLCGRVAGPYRGRPGACVDVGPVTICND